MSNQDLLVIDNKLLQPNITAYQKNRLLSISYSLQGRSIKEIAQQLNISARSVQRYLQVYERDGLLLQDTLPGNKFKLDRNQRAELDKDIKKSPNDFSLPASEWTPQLLQHHISAKYEIKLSVETCRKLLHELNTSASTEKQSPHPYIREQQFEALLKEKSVESNATIWILGRITIGKRVPYKTKTDSKIPEQATILCGVNYRKQHEFICLWHNPYRREEQTLSIISKIEEATGQSNAIIFFPKNPTNRSITNKLLAKGKLTISYIPAGVKLQSLFEAVRNKILNEARLPTKNIYNSQLNQKSERRIREIIRWQ